jgi:uncharacterized protein (DUF488 family)
VRICTIGYTKKSLRDFVSRLTKNNVQKVIDVRLNNNSQLAGFSKKEDLKYILELVGIDYEHNVDLAPTKSLLKDYKEKKITWEQYEQIFRELLVERNPKINNINKYRNICFLCTEDKATNCHRRLVAEYYQKKAGGVIKHI